MEPDLRQLWIRNAEAPRAICTTVQELITQRAGAQGDLPAVISWDGEYNYQQFMHLASSLGGYLSRNVCRHHGKVLPIIMGKSKWMPIAMVGALLGGWGIAPLDVETPTTRLAEILDMLDAPCILTTSETAIAASQIVPVLPVNGLRLEDKSLGVQWQPSENVTAKVAAVVFTSGSTGSPKGVMIGPECISTSAVHGSQILGLDQSSRLFQFCSFSFDISLHEIFMTLVAGGCLCIPSEEERLNNPIAAINRMHATSICTTPSVMMSVLAEDVASTPIKTVVLAGEALTSRVRPLLDMGLNIFNWYGSTECPIVSLAPLSEKLWVPSQLGSRSPGNCWVVHAEDLDVLCGVGEVGELLVESPMMTLGYLNAPQQTEAAFVIDPKWLTDGHNCVAGRRGTLYRTGDLVRTNNDWTIDFIGRKDTMLKIRGQRVDLSEVELRIWNYLRSGELGSSVRVLEVLVEPINFGQDSDNVSICCLLYVDSEINLPQKPLATSASAPSIRICAPDLLLQGLQSELDRSLRATIPSYMIPSLYFQLSDVPFTPSGKIDRRLLRSLSSQISHRDLMACRMNSQEDLILPSNDVERALCRLWAEVLGVEVDAILVNMSFLQCGGDSLRAISLSKALVADFKFPAKVPELLRQETTVQYLATQILQHNSGQTIDEPQMDISAVLKGWESNLRTVSIRPPLVQPPRIQGSQVLLTGATGYLGTHILGELFRSHLVTKVIALVRAADIDSAKERIRQIAVTSGWWQKNAFCRIEVFVGNLTEPRLGLQEKEWAELSTVDTIIHNGAVVNYSAGYDILEKPNVVSTFYLLEAALQSQHLRTFIFVSGGIKKMEGQSDEDYLQTLNNSEGYSQTKYLSEQLTLAAGKLYDESVNYHLTCENEPKSSSASRRFIVAKPGYIIGDQLTGLSNTDDFIWKLVAGAVCMGSFPSDPADYWLDVAEVTYIAKHVVSLAQLQSPDASNGIAIPPITGHDNASGIEATNSTVLFDDIKRGLPVCQFWEAIQSQARISLKQKDWDAWIGQASVDLERLKESHPLWGIQLFLGPSIGSRRRAEQVPVGSMGAFIASEGVEAAVKRCVEYLCNIHFIIPPSTEEGLKQSNGKYLGSDIDYFINNYEYLVAGKELGSPNGDCYYPIISRSKLIY